MDNNGVIINKRANKELKEYRKYLIEYKGSLNKKHYDKLKILYVKTYGHE
jgi:hypothetical protein